MTIDRPSSDILIFNPPPQSIKDFRVVHRSAIIPLIIILAVAIAIFLFGTIFCFYWLLRYQIYFTSSSIIAILIAFSFGAVFGLVYASLSIYILRNIKTPILVQSCIFDRSLGKLSIQQYNLFDRQIKTIEVPLSVIVDVQVRNYPVQLADDFLSISLMTRQSSKPVYIFQRSLPKQIPSPIMKSLLKEVEIIRAFLHLPSEPPYLITDRLKWYEVIFTASTSTEWLQSIAQTNDTLVCDLRSRRYGRGSVWKFDRTTAPIKIERRTFLGKSSKYLTRSEIKTIAIKTEFLPLEYTSYELIGYLHRRQYQKQYSAILIPHDRSSLKSKDSYWRIFTSNDLSMVEDLVDRVRAHLDLPLDGSLSNQSIELDQVGAIK
jgi:hypothetical protein